MWRLPISSATLTNASWAGAKVRMIAGNNAGFYIEGDARNSGAGTASVSLTPEGDYPSGVVRPCVYVTDYPAVAEYDLSGGSVTAMLTGTAPYSVQYNDGTSATLTSSSVSITNGNVIASFVDATGSEGKVQCAASTIHLSSGEATQRQTLCAGSAMTAASYTLGGAATSYTLAGLPAGLSEMFDEASRVLTISGTPTASGTYTITTTGHIAPCTAVEISGAVTVNANPSIGTQPAAQTVCSGANATLTVAAAAGSGSITTYQWYKDNVPTGTADESSSSLETGDAGNYYVQVSNSNKCTINSGTVTVTVNPTSTGGAIAGSSTICSGSAAGDLTLSGHTGSVIQWQQSADKAAWTDVDNTTTALSPGSLTQTTYYRAEVKSGVCPVAYSSAATVIVNPVPAAAGSITGPTVMSFNTSATYSVATIAGAASYVWAVTNATVPSPATSNSVTVQFGAAATTATISVYGTNNYGCGTGAASTLSVTVDAGTMQEFNPVGGTIGSTWILTDTRNNVAYKVRLMEDGRYWMVDDLKYPDGCNKTTFSGATAAGSPGKNNIAGFIGDCHNIKDGNTPANRGYLYDWMGAMQNAQAYYKSSWNPNCTANGSSNALCRGICPEGWHLPTGNPTNGEFTLLNTAVNGGSTSSDAGLRAGSNFNGVYGGNSTNTGALSYQGSRAYYWSSSYTNTSNAYYLGFTSTYVGPSYSNSKHLGNTIRCIRNY